MSDHTQIMTDKQITQGHLLLQLLQQQQDLRLYRYIECRYRLITNNHSGFQHQRPGNANALALASGELMGVLLHIGFAQTDTLQHPDHLVMPFFLSAELMYQQPLADDLPHTHARVERGKRILKHHLQKAALFAQSGT